MLSFSSYARHRHTFIIFVRSPLLYVRHRRSFVRRASYAFSLSLPPCCLLSRRRRLLRAATLARCAPWFAALLLLLLACASAAFVRLPLAWHASTFRLPRDATVALSATAPAVGSATLASTTSSSSGAALHAATSSAIATGHGGAASASHGTLKGTDNDDEYYGTARSHGDLVGLGERSSSRNRSAQHFPLVV